jgi:PadR family transcriptional regulator, regulatory protein PadR
MRKYQERNGINPKQIHTKLTKGMLEMVILQYLDQEPVHGYQIITKIRKGYGIYFGPSTVYPILCALEKKGYLKSTWEMDSERPRKVYALTQEGKNALDFSANCAWTNIAASKNSFVVAWTLSCKPKLTTGLSGLLKKG